MEFDNARAIASDPRLSGEYPLIHLDTRLADYLRPFRDPGLDNDGKVSRRAGDCFKAEIGKFRTHIGQRKRFDGLNIEILVPVRTKPTSYPEPFGSRMAGREKRPLGDLFGLSNFGVNLTRLASGAASAQLHAHSKQDEFLYVVEGHPVLITNQGETSLAPQAGGRFLCLL